MTMTQEECLAAINKDIKDFSWINAEYICEIHYIVEKNEYYEDIFNMDLGFVVCAKNGKQYKLRLKFYEVQNLSLCARGGLIQLSLFEILDVKADGWSATRYWVRDIESESINFYCNNIEFISVEKSDIKVP